MQAKPEACSVESPIVSGALTPGSLQRYERLSQSVVVALTGVLGEGLRRSRSSQSDRKRLSSSFPKWRHPKGRHSIREPVPRVLWNRIHGPAWSETCE